MSPAAVSASKSPIPDILQRKTKLPKQAKLAARPGPLTPLNPN